MPSKTRIVQDKKINETLRPLLLAVREQLRNIADIFVEDNVDEADACIFVNQMLLSEMKKSNERKIRETEMAN